MGIDIEANVVSFSPFFAVISEMGKALRISPN